MMLCTAKPRGLILRKLPQQERLPFGGRRTNKHPFKPAAQKNCKSPDEAKRDTVQRPSLNALCGVSHVACCCLAQPARQRQYPYWQDQNRTLTARWCAAEQRAVRRQSLCAAWYAFLVVRGALCPAWCAFRVFRCKLCKCCTRSALHELSVARVLRCTLRRAPTAYEEVRSQRAVLHGPAQVCVQLQFPRQRCSDRGLQTSVRNASTGRAGALVLHRTHARARVWLFAHTLAACAKKKGRSGQRRSFFVNAASTICALHATRAYRRSRLPQPRA